jgi:hypothetical protein
VVAIVSLLTSAAKLSLVTAKFLPRQAMPPGGSTGQVRRCRIGRQSILRGKLDMPETPTFGRYAEIPYDEMTPEQQEGYLFLVETRGAAGGPSKIWVHNPKLVKASAPLGAYFHPGGYSLSEREIAVIIYVLTERPLLLLEPLDALDEGLQLGPVRGFGAIQAVTMGKSCSSFGLVLALIVKPAT